MVAHTQMCTVDGVSSSGAPTPGADTTADSRETSADSTNRSLGTESETKLVCVCVFCWVLLN